MLLAPITILQSTKNLFHCHNGHEPTFSTDVHLLSSISSYARYVKSLTANGSQPDCLHGLRTAQRFVLVFPLVHICVGLNWQFQPVFDHTEIKTISFIHSFILMPCTFIVLTNSVVVNSHSSITL